MSHDPLARVLAALPSAKANGTGWIARCPAHDDEQPSLSIASGAGGRVLLHCHANCEPPAIVAALGLTMADLFVEAPQSSDRETTYDYRDEADGLLFQVVRLPGKRFRQRRPDGNGGWIWSLN